jgi:adenylate kinase
VRRLDAYKVEKPELMEAVVAFIETKMMPIIVRHAISGRADINTEDKLFHDPEALVILIDIFSERGFHAKTDVHVIEIPDSFDLQTGKIECRKKKVFRIAVQFKGSEIRRG